VEEKEMKVISCFDGIAGAYQALKNQDVSVSEYHAFEIDKHAIQIAKKNHPDIKHIGSIEDWLFYQGLFDDNIDLIIGGSPCQDLSIAGQQKGLKGSRSGLFFQMADMIKTLKPKYFLVENVASMKSCQRDIISKELGIEPIMIDSALVTAQNRKRYYWTNIPVIEQPNDRGVLLKDIIETGFVDREKSYPLTATYQNAIPKDYLIKKQRQLVFELNKLNSRIKGVSINNGGIRPHQGDDKKSGISELGRIAFKNSQKINSVISSHTPKLIEDDLTIRKLTPKECERLQGFPDNYTEGVSNTQRYKSLGNSFTVPVIEWILKGILK
jgi:DNA (cytosine-5)-methyltransferase 3A